MFKALPVVFFPNPVEAIVTQGIANRGSGRVKCRGVSWKAKFYNTSTMKYLEVGCMVKVIGLEGNTLLI